jgi:hypothetical protein
MSLAQGKILREAVRFGVAAGAAAVMTPGTELCRRGDTERGSDTGRDTEGLVSEGVLAIEMGALAEDVGLSIHSHPSLSETIGEAAELFTGGVTHLLPKKIGK